MSACAEFETLLRQTMGLDAASVGSTTVERAVRQRMAACAIEAIDEYRDRLMNSVQELQELIEAVIVPETWFFRDSEAFAALARLVIEDRLSTRPSDAVKLLSVPCSTGEEPYSMVMALLDGGLPPHRMKVDAIDISTRNLAYARRGIYGRNSFRGENTDFRERYFRSGPNGHELTERLAGTVSFHLGNLVSNSFPRPGAPYDVVFCRNLLIYFDRSTQESVMKTLASLLAPDGLLFVGPAEAYLAASSGFTSVNRAMSFAFRKSPIKRLESTTIPAPRIQRHLKPHPAPLHPPPLEKARPNKVKAPEPIKRAGSAEYLAEAHRLADLGRLQEAVSCCQSNIREQGPSVESYYLLGVVHDAAGDRNQAAEYYRRTVYLDPNHVEALTHLALLTEGQGDAESARRLRERAQRASEHGGIRKA